MTPVLPPAPRERILQAALALLESGGVEAVSTRAVSAAAAVQPPTIYRQFGDMQGLLNAVASVGFTAYLRTKTAQAPLSDPVEELREGWRTYVGFGLAHPHLYTLMYASSQTSMEAPAALEAAAVLRALMRRVAEAGRLAVSVERAAIMIHAAALGTALSLLGDSDSSGDGELSEQMLEAVLNTVLVPSVGTAGVPVQQSQAAAHAVSLAALLPGLQARFSEAEHALLLDWLRRLM
ncbi:TetR/AcrR family transcriptional regulator (plasmid) [Deinococcus radiomollis]|uniref:TetR/AcrR family transcriptional regulator n=1 Tax=Deinococcus radiomollis TaxID=468916 RepID=UPI003892B8A9